MSTDTDTHEPAPMSIPRIQFDLPIASLKFCPKCGISTSEDQHSLLAHFSDCFQSPEKFQFSQIGSPWSDHPTTSVSRLGLVKKAKVKVKRVPVEKRVKRAKHECPVCLKKFRSAQYLPDHMNTHTGDRPYECDQCDKTFRNRTVLRQHLSTHSMGKTYECDKCDKVFKRLESLRYHESSHSTERPCICATCGKTFRNDKDLRIHERTVHSDQVLTKKDTPDKPKTCELCAEAFKNYNAYHYHKKTKHCLGHACVKCDFVAPTQGQLEMHERKHTGEKPFPCRFCDKKFTRASLRKVHEARHTGNSLFSCMICGKGFPQKSELKAHERTHEAREGISETFECSQCGDCMKTKTEYGVHLRLHHGDISDLSSVPEHEDIFHNMHPSDVLESDYHPSMEILKTD